MRKWIMRALIAVGLIAVLGSITWLLLGRPPAANPGGKRLGKKDQSDMSDVT